MQKISDSGKAVCGSVALTLTTANKGLCCCSLFEISQVRNYKKRFGFIIARCYLYCAIIETISIQRISPKTNIVYCAINARPRVLDKKYTRRTIQFIKTQAHIRS